MKRRFHRQVQALAQVFELAGEFCASRGIGPDTKWVIDFTLEELFTNVVRHNPGGNGDVLIELEVRNGSVVMTVTDFDSDRFDPAAAKPADVDAPLERRRPGGLGIHLVKNMTDDIRYEYRDRVSRTIVTKTLG